MVVSASTPSDDEASAPGAAASAQLGLPSELGPAPLPPHCTIPHCAIPPSAPASTQPRALARPAPTT
eukprot:scaffold34168_cov66-Phaeocystis_antarctica.AAC.2